MEQKVECTLIDGYLGLENEDNGLEVYSETISGLAEKYFLLSNMTLYSECDYTKHEFKEAWSVSLYKVKFLKYNDELCLIPSSFSCIPEFKEEFYKEEFYAKLLELFILTGGKII